MSFSSSLKDALTLDIKQIGNEFVSNALLCVGFEYMNIGDKIFSEGDNSLVQGVKLGAVVSAVTVVGAKARQALPMLNVF